MSFRPLCEDKLDGVLQRHEKYTSPFVLTDNPADIPLILLDGVELVLWRYGQAEETKQAIEAFDESQFNLSREFLDMQKIQFMEGGRLYVTSRGKHSFPGLDPLWRERRRVKTIFDRALRQNSVMEPLAVQRKRRSEPDCLFHVDVCTGMDSKADQMRNDVIYAMTAHKGIGSVVIPRCDAGRPTPRVHENRACYYHPLRRENIVSPRQGDLAVMKAGTRGTVHRSQKAGAGLRWWTFFQAQGTIYTLRRNFSRQEKQELRRRFRAYRSLLPDSSALQSRDSPYLRM